MNIKEVKKYSKIENNIKVIKLAEGKMINVKKYLPSADKMMFILDLINRCVDKGKVIPVSVDIVAYMNIVIYYTDLEIDLGEEENEITIFEAYDIMVQTGLLKKILEVIPQDEIEQMFEYIKESIEYSVNHDNSIAGGLGEMGQVIAKTAIPEFVDMVKENPDMLDGESAECEPTIVK